MKVMMVPNALNLISGESGIHTLVRAWTKHFPAAGIELVDPKANSFDLLAVHAGMSQERGSGAPMVAHLHGLYWTADYQAKDWEWKTNKTVIDSLRHATSVTVPSSWVAETFQRDMHLDPYIVGHGIDWQEWQHKEPNDGYVLWNKNRSGDVCTPKPLGELAMIFPKQKFLTTFAPESPTPNIKATGIVKHVEMRRMVQRAGVYLATTKETFGIGILEAMASGVPVLGFRHGGILEMVEHGVNGYLARPDNYEDLAKGLEYCLKHRAVLGANGREIAKRFTWQRVAEQLAGIYTETITKYHEPPTVAVVIPCYNLADRLPRAVESVMVQTVQPDQVIIVDNNSTDSTRKVAAKLAEKYQTVRYVNEDRQGVAHARNRGIRETTTKYIVPLDADDAIAPGFIAACVKALEAERDLGVAYTRLRWVKADGATGVSEWPGQYNYDEFLKKRNQVPTCAMFRREMWQRLGGYRQRYAPHGAGAEDAEFFLRAGAYGWGAKLATEEPLFVYSWGTGQVSGNRDYQEPDWLAGKPWVQDGLHPFASLATPKKQAHPVRQYDEPVVSVVIPCGPNHLQYLVDAIDSIEAQTFRKWELIIAFDGVEPDPHLLAAYPFVRPVRLGGKGAGAARNAGAKLARGAFLLFLDADDALRPNAMLTMMQAWQQDQAIIYSDYAGHAIIDDAAEIQKLQMRSRLESYDSRTKRAVVLHQSFDFDCERAIRQPEMNGGQFYIWNLITSLTPRRWHEEIGGFDESMESWEDWDYWLRMARKGKCFVRVREPLVDYRFDTGTRRETGRQIHKHLLEYMTVKYAGEEPMGCTSCGGKRTQTPATPQQAMMAPQMSAQMSAANVVWVRLNDGNYGEHPIIGTVTRTNYGLRSHGALFKMVAQDAAAMPQRFVVVADPQTIVPAAVAVAETAEPEAIEAPEPVAFAEWDEKPKRGRPRK